MQTNIEHFKNHFELGFLTTRRPKWKPLCTINFIPSLYWKLLKLNVKTLYFTGLQRLVKDSMFTIRSCATRVAH